ncbi:SusC/RagA family TonB-linked outer membrane protein [Flavobacterium sp. xlx-214]|uniref:SusC/RagA family TonB-linked outer membrane protein n=1 Tax=unclassified Flavobacterium TaxID=196869 RepID=UPI0013D0759C|nr:MULTISPECIES: SusC/RagA family TonB-linked outer membrane protein [unclassified Flavobacterium]MBA5793407.1 SusC/RagA family TonB-linked outer membrane protein [Flavobacterium sp. xlx-221]QMI84033.1 SusC/RagA family TonB-linked outer membrane protein [Flavobacterium sp. xlx-214]
MRSKFTWILTLFLVFMAQIGFAQKPVTGVVKTQDGDPIPGASILIVGTPQGTETDEEGRYTLTLKKGDKIKVEYLGFKAATVTATDSGVLNVTLVEDDAIGLEEVVIDTYRTTSKKENATSVSSVTSKTIEGRPNASIIQTLQGQVPGLNIMTGSGQPGASSQVTLRGLGSINGSTEPLYVIDGVPMSSSRFRSLNPNEIDRVDILKDAGATAIYGNRGANGVIVITTKRGSFDADLSIRYIGTTGVSSIQRNQYNLMDTQDYVNFVNGANRYYPSITKFSPAVQKGFADTKWTDVFFNDAISQSHTVTFSGGAKNISSFTSVGYSEFGGILRGTDLKRFNVRNNLDGKNASGKLTYGTTFNVNYSKSNMENAAGTNGVNQNYFLGAFQSLPYLSPNSYINGWDLYEKYRDRKIGTADGMPLMLMDKMKTSGFGQNELKVLVNGNIAYKLNDNFKLSNQTGADYQTINQNSWTRYDAFNEYLFGVPQNRKYFGRVGDIFEERFIFNTNTNLRYEETFNEVHKVSAGVFLEYLKAHFRSRSISKQGFDPIFWSDGGSTGWIGSAENYQLYSPTASLSRSDAGLFSYFGTASYDYDGRYGLDATIRRDASFRFTDDNRWGTFWSVAGRWNIDSEKFMENSVFNTLKLRASYGSAGNQDITNSGLFGGAHLYDTRYGSGVGYNQETGLALTGLPNRGLQWEVITQSNIGLDFGVWKDRLRGSLDVYRKQTDELYLDTPISAINGSSTINANFGSMKNEGVELNIAGDLIRNDETTLTLRLVGAYNKNTVLDIPTEDGTYWDGSLVGYRQGHMVNEFFMADYIGINPDNGNMMFRSKDGGVTEEPTDADYQWLGKSSMPVYQGGFGLDLQHKGWFLTADFTYALDAWRYDNEYYFFTAPSGIKANNLSNDLNDYWTKDNRDAKFPALNGSNFAYGGGSDFYLQDASYLRLRYLTVGYNFKKKDLDFLKLSGLRVYAQGENIYTWTKWRGWDAESSRAVDFGQYPTPRTISFGLEVQF